MQQIDGVVIVLVVDVYMLVKDCCLLCQIVKMFDGFDIVWVIVDLLVLSGMKGVGIVVVDLQMMVQCCVLDCLLDGVELDLCMVDVVVYFGGDFQYVFGDVVFGFFYGQFMLDVGNQC